MKYPLNEGTLTIPDHWRDDSVNIFTISQTEGTNLVISRQKVPLEASHADYLNQQVDSFDEGLERFKKINKHKVEVDGATGVSMEYTFHSPEGPMHQLTTMLIKGQLFVSMTFTHPGKMTDHHKKGFMSVIQQFTFNEQQEAVDDVH